MVTVHGQSLSVIPAQAGIQSAGAKSCCVLLDSRLRGNDGGHRAFSGKRTILFSVNGYDAWQERAS